MEHYNHLVNNQKVFFNYMNENYTIFQYSNIFFRDLQYAIMSYFETIENPVKYSKAEDLAKKYIEKLVETGDFIKIDNKSWKLNFEVGIVKTVSEPEGVENE